MLCHIFRVIDGLIRKYFRQFRYTLQNPVFPHPRRLFNFLKLWTNLLIVILTLNPLKEWYFDLKFAFRRDLISQVLELFVSHGYLAGYCFFAAFLSGGYDWRVVPVCGGLRVTVRLVAWRCRILPLRI